MSRYRTLHDRRLATFGEARWRDAPDGASFSYLEFSVDDLAYNVGDSQPARR